MSINEDIKKTIDMLKRTDIDGCITGSSMIGDAVDYDTWESVPDVDLFVYHASEIQHAVDTLVMRFGYFPATKGDEWKIRKMRCRDVKSNLSLQTVKLKHKDSDVLINISWKEKRDNIFAVLSSFDMSIIMVGYNIKDKLHLDLRVSSVWSEGYTKKLGACLGNYNQAYEKRNLIILDISGSIPRGVSSTMLVLVPTLRERCNADLIVTGSKSLWIPGGEEVDPQEIRNQVGYGNESVDFLNILNEHVFGKAWGNIIVFGDDDRPVKLMPTCDTYGVEYDSYEVKKQKLLDKLDWSSTSVEHLWSYHTRYKKTCGYGKWVEELFDYKVPATINTEWCSIMENRW